jgi:hypothetical protein
MWFSKLFTFYLFLFINNCTCVNNIYRCAPLLVNLKLINIVYYITPIFPLITGIWLNNIYYMNVIFFSSLASKSFYFCLLNVLNYVFWLFLRLYDCNYGWTGLQLLKIEFLELLVRVDSNSFLPPTLSIACHWSLFVAQHLSPI